MKKILIIGSSGQVGGALQDILSEELEYTVAGADIIADANTAQVDITDSESLEKCFMKYPCCLLTLSKIFFISKLLHQVNYTRNVNGERTAAITGLT